MLLIHRSPRAAKAVDSVSPTGELFVASVVMLMILASFGDFIDPAFLGEGGLEFALFDFGGELSLMALHQWHLLALLLGGMAVTAGLCVLRIVVGALADPLRPSDRDPIEKVPISLRR